MAAQKKLLPDFKKFKLNKRGVSFLRECIIIMICLKKKPLLAVCSTFNKNINQNARTIGTL